jgi:hypothetical protein
MFPFLRFSETASRAGSANSRGSQSPTLLALQIQRLSQDSIELNNNEEIRLMGQ